MAAFAHADRPGGAPGADATNDLLDPAFLQRLEILSLVSRRRLRGGHAGQRRSILRGRGIEFADYRGYEPGDDYRYIDWNIASRLDRLFVKLFSEEEDLDVTLLVDTSASMAAGTPSKLALAKYLAAAIGYIGLVNLDRVGVTAFTSGSGSRLSRLRGRARATDLLRFLGGLRPSGETDLGLALRHLLADARRRGLLVVLSDLFDPRGYDEALRLVRSHGFQTFLIHILAEDELTPRLGGELRLIDVETREAVEVVADAEALRSYADACDAFFRQIEGFCFRHAIDYVRTVSSAAPDTLVLHYLRQAGLLR